MIFADSEAHHDTPSKPAHRPGNCMQCFRIWKDHHGWACPDSAITMRGRTFENLHAAYRFCTPEMRATVSNAVWSANEKPLGSRGLSKPVAPTAAKPVPQPPQKSLEVPQWKLSLSLSMKDGECPCGIARSVCSFHR